MTDTMLPPEDDDSPQVTVRRKDIRRLEKQAAAGKEALEKLNALESQMAFTAGGVTPDHPAAQYFIKGYEGERTPEAIKAAWEKVAGASQGQPDQPEIDQELASLEGGQSLADGIGLPPPNKLACVSYRRLQQRVSFLRLAHYSRHRG